MLIQENDAEKCVFCLISAKHSMNNFMITNEF